MNPSDAKYRTMTEIIGDLIRDKTTGGISISEIVIDTMIMPAAEMIQKEEKRLAKLKRIRIDTKKWMDKRGIKGMKTKYGYIPIPSIDFTNSMWYSPELNPTMWVRDDGERPVGIAMDTTGDNDRTVSMIIPYNFEAVQYPRAVGVMAT